MASSANGRRLPRCGRDWPCIIEYSARRCGTYESFQVHPPLVSKHLLQWPSHPPRSLWCSGPADEHARLARDCVLPETFEVEHQPAVTAKSFARLSPELLKQAGFADAGSRGLYGAAALVSRTLTSPLRSARFRVRQHMLGGRAAAAKGTQSPRLPALRAFDGEFTTSGDSDRVREARR